MNGFYEDLLNKWPYFLKKFTPITSVDAERSKFEIIRKISYNSMHSGKN